MKRALVPFTCSILTPLSNTAFALTAKYFLSPSASAVEITIGSLADHWAANETINLFRYSLSATKPFTASLTTSLVSKVVISVFNAFTACPANNLISDCVFSAVSIADLRATARIDSASLRASSTIFAASSRALLISRCASSFPFSTPSR